MPVVETDVTIKTPDGTCDAAFIHPTTGFASGRADLDRTRSACARRCATSASASPPKATRCCVPNPFYRVAKAPVFDNAASFNFQNPADMAKLQPLMGVGERSGKAEKDAVAYIAFLDAQPQVNKSKKIGTQGYCMGGPLVVKTCAALPNRVGAGAFVPRRRSGHRQARQPASARAEDQGADVFRHRLE